MKMCWDKDPKSRPGFSDLVSTLVSLGAVESGADDVVTADKKASETAVARRSFSNDRKLLGPSVHHITTVLVPKVLSAVRPPWTDSRGNGVPSEGAATIEHAVLAVAKPAGANRKCPRDGGVGCAYVDTLKGADHVGNSTALLSCE